MTDDRENVKLGVANKLVHLLFLQSVNIYPLHSCDYRNKSSMKTNVATDEGNSRNEM